MYDTGSGTDLKGEKFREATAGAHHTRTHEGGAAGRGLLSEPPAVCRVWACIRPKLHLQAEHLLRRLYLLLRTMMLGFSTQRGVMAKFRDCGHDAEIKQTRIE